MNGYPVGEGTVHLQIAVPENAPPIGDLFEAMADFEIHPLAFELWKAREAERVWRDKALAAESCLHQALHVLDRPLSKYKKADLVRLVGIAQDTLLAFEHRLFLVGRTE